MTLRTLIVDDETLARSRLRTLLNDCKTPGVSVAGEAANAVQAVEMLRRTPCDLALLDIHMPGGDGLVLAQALQQLPQPPAVVFVTAYAEHAVRAFELEAVDYLTKPVRLERLQQALLKVLRLRHRSINSEALPSGVLLIQERGRTERVPLAEVLYFKAELKYITVRTANKNYVLDGVLSELEEKHSQHFLRIHRNALVAKNSIRALVKHDDPEEGEGWAVLLSETGERLSVSRRQLVAVRAALKTT